MSEQTRQERRRAAQSHKTFPKIDVSFRFNVKKSESGAIVFTYWNKDKGENGETIETAKSLKGIYIGEAMFLSSFNREKNIFYRSSVYSKNENNVLIFAGNELDRNFSGNVGQAKEYLSVKSKATVKIIRLFYVATAHGLISVETSLPISICQIKAIKKANPDAFVDNYIILSPSIYDPADNVRFDKKVHELLSITKANKNYPCFASVEVGEIIPEMVFDEYDEERFSEEYRLWLEFINTVSSENINNHANDNADAVTSQTSVDDIENADYNQMDQEDDLPF